MVKVKLVENAIAAPKSLSIVRVIAQSEADDRHVLATDCHVARSRIAKSRGLMGKKPLQPDTALVFPFSSTAPRRIHTMFVRETIDVLWISQEQVTAIETMDPWSIGPKHRADMIIELPADTATSIDSGWIVRLDASSGD